LEVRTGVRSGKIPKQKTEAASLSRQFLKSTSNKPKWEQNKNKTKQKPTKNKIK
jgi:hypothetical protein